MTGPSPAGFRPAAGKSRWASLLALLAALGLTAVLYGRTICPTVFWGDGTELTAAAHCLGIAHPSGYPLFTLLGRIFLWAPFGTPGFRMNLLSACSAALAAGLLFGLAGDVVRLARPGADPRSPGALALRAGMALQLAFSRFLWQQAVITEVYATMTAALVACLWLIVRAAASRSNRPVGALAFAWGIAWQCHLLAVTLAPAVALLGLRLIRPRPRLPACEREGDAQPSVYAGEQDAPPACRGEKGGNNRLAQRQPLHPRHSPLLALAMALLFFLIGLGGYLGLALRARANPPMNWGDPSTLARLASHISGGQFKHTKILTLSGSGTPLRGAALRRYLRARAERIVSWPAAQFLPAKLDGSRLESAAGAFVWLVALAGLGLLGWRRGLLGWGLGGTLAVGIAVLMIYAIPDIEAYFLAIWPLLLTLFWAAVILGGRQDERRPNVAVTTAVLALGLGLLAARSNFSSCNLSRYREAEAYGRRLMESLPKNALLLTGDDNTIFAAWYQQVVEGRRPDVVVYGLNFIFQGWYRAYFQTPQAQRLSLFVSDRPPTSEADWVVAVGGGVIIPNVNRTPVFAALADQWQRAALLTNWRAQFVEDLLDPDAPPPPIVFAPPALSLYRLRDNPEYRAYQETQFSRMYGGAAAGEHPRAKG